MDAELIFWLVCGVLAIFFVVAVPFINNYYDSQETKRMFAERDFVPYHDDMEDWQ